jgi:mycothiol system anti-sigma-R factor
MPDLDTSDERCAESLRQLHTYLDGELTPDRRHAIAEHLDHCNQCLEAFDFEAELRVVVAERCREEVPASLRERIAQALAEVEPEG